MIILIIIACIIAIPFIAALFMSKGYRIEREIIIEKQKQEVFHYIKLLSNQVMFNKWMREDTHLNIKYHGTDGTKGFVAAWDSNLKRVGKGDQEITAVVDGQSIDITIRFIKPFEGNANSCLTTVALSDNQTLVRWAFTGYRNYVNRMMHLLFNLPNMLGKDLQESLNNLKHILEK